MKVRDFNEKYRNEINIWLSDNGGNVSETRYDVARNFLAETAKSIGESPCHAEFCNRSKNPQNNIQIALYLDSGNVIYGAFVYVNDKFQPVKSKSNIELLSADWEVIKVI